jgi:DNA-nicking Smr family endonuclease
VSTGGDAVDDDCDPVRDHDDLDDERPAGEPDDVGIKEEPEEDTSRDRRRSSDTSLSMHGLTLSAGRRALPSVIYRGHARHARAREAIDGRLHRRLCSFGDA